MLLHSSLCVYFRHGTRPAQENNNKPRPAPFLFLTIPPHHGVGAAAAMPDIAAHAAIQTPCCVMQAATAAGTPTPAVKVPATTPAVAQHETKAVLQPVWQAAYTPAAVAGPARQLGTRKFAAMSRRSTNELELAKAGVRMVAG